MNTANLLTLAERFGMTCRDMQQSGAAINKSQKEFTDALSQLSKAICKGRDTAPIEAKLAAAAEQVRSVIEPYRGQLAEYANLMSEFQSSLAAQ